MSDFKFNCPHCAQSLEAPEDMLGQTIECPACNGSIQLPKPEPQQKPQMQAPRKRIVVQRHSPPLQSGSTPSPSRRTPPSSKGKVVVPILIVALLFGALYFASPYWSLFRMRKAVENNDAVYVSDHVDFPQLRESLKATFKTQMAKEVATSDADGFEALGAALGAMMIGPMVDALVTPEGLIGMMQGKDLGEIDPASPGSSDGSHSTPSEAEMNIAEMGYETLNRFVVKVGEASEEESLSLVFNRHGLFFWKLARIRLQLPASPASPDMASVPEEPAGWQLRTDTSPIDDSKSYFLSRDADEPIGSGFMSSTPTLMIRHKEGNLEVYITFGTYLGSDTTMVTTRIGSSSATQREWGLSTDGKAIFCPTDDAEFVRQLLANDRLVIRLTPYGESPVTSSFDLTGLAEAMEPMRHLIR